MVEARGIEPLSKNSSAKASTYLARVKNSPPAAHSPKPCRAARLEFARTLVRRTSYTIKGLPAPKLDSIAQKRGSTATQLLRKQERNSRCLRLNFADFLRFVQSGMPPKPPYSCRSQVAPIILTKCSVL